MYIKIQLYHTSASNAFLSCGTSLTSVLWGAACCSLVLTYSPSTTPRWPTCPCSLCLAGAALVLVNTKMELRKINHCVALAKPSVWVWAKGSWFKWLHVSWQAGPHPSLTHALQELPQVSALFSELRPYMAVELQCMISLAPSSVQGRGRDRCH